MVRKSFSLSLFAGIFLLVGNIQSQEDFLDTFLQSPVENDWVFRGSAHWVPDLESEAADELGMMPCVEDSDPDDGFVERDDTNSNPGARIDVDPFLGTCQGPCGAAANACNLYEEAVLPEAELDIDRDGDVDDDDVARLQQLVGDNGYINVAPASGGIGSAWRAQKRDFDNFQMEVVMEMRDGTRGRPADGLTIVIAGELEPDNEDEVPPQTGAGGGAMGSTGLGDRPHIIFEFDNWSCNNGDQNDQNHVGVTYSANGFPAVDAICSPRLAPCQNDLFVRIDENQAPFNHRLAPGDPNYLPNRFLMIAKKQQRTMAIDLIGLDIGVDFGTVGVITLDDLEPFRGFVGLTASTGGATQNHLVHSVRITTIEGCISPGATVRRTVDGPRTPEENCGDFLEGDEFNVTVTVSDLLADDPDTGCTRPTELIVTETAPMDWEISNVSDGGMVDDATITWTLTGGNLVRGKELNYTLRAVETGAATASIRGTSKGNDHPASSTSSTTLIKDTGFDATCGGITCWNLLGPYLQPGGNNPGNDLIREDYLTDGAISESDLVWEPFKEVDTDFGGASISAGLHPANIDARGPTGVELNPEGIPVILPYSDTDSFINVNDDFYTGDPNDVMCYAQIYVISDEEREVFMGVSSDDSVQVLLNGEEAWINSVARGGANACNPQDTTTEPVILEEGQNSIIVKTFEGGGGFNFAFRFQDELGQPVTEGLTLSRKPVTCATPPLTATRTIPATGTTSIQGREVPSWRPDEEFRIEIALTGIRPVIAGPPDCPAATAVTISEFLPAGWEAADPSAGGQVDEDENGNPVVTWSLSGGELRARTLAYTAIAPGEGQGNAAFRGRVADRTPGGSGNSGVGGDGQLVNPTDLTEVDDVGGGGYIKTWLLLGPFQNDGGAAPGPDLIRQDYLTDGVDLTETDVQPVDGDEALSLTPLNDPFGVNPGGVATWTLWRDRDDLINFNDFYGGDVNQCMMYAVTYFELEETADLEIEVGTDDSVQVLLDGEEVWINDIPRGVPAPGAGDIVFIEGIDAGIHTLMVKVFEGGGAHSLRLRFFDPVEFFPFTDYRICTVPDCSEEPPPPVGTRFIRGDVTADGALNITDAVRGLGIQFLGDLPVVDCLEIQDVNDDGAINITDPISSLGFQFLGGPPPKAPFPTCGLDPEGSPDSGCASFPPCTP